MEVVAVVLAAGAARRFGRPKQLEPWPGPDGPTLVERATGLAAASPVAGVVVVTGNRAEEVERRLAARSWPRPVLFCYNSRWEQGQGYSVAAGVAAARQSFPEAAGILFMLADQPRLRATTIETLLRYFVELDREAWSAIIFPVYGGRRGNPVIFGQTFFEALSRLEGDTGGRSVIKTYPKAVREVAVDDPAIHEDVDTPDDLAKLSGLSPAYPPE